MTMAKLTHPDSLYASEQGPQSSHSVGALPKRIRHLIIGGGLTGLQCGCQLAARGEEVLLLEQGPVAWGASGRNGGQVLPGFAWGPSQLASALGEERARRLWQKSRGAVQLVAEQAQEQGVLVQWGGGELAARPGHVSGISKFVHDAGHWGHELHQFGKDEAVERTGSRKFFGGFVDQQALHLDPLAFAQSLGRKYQALGGRLLTDSKVMVLSRQGRQFVAHTPSGDVRADFVYACTNAWTSALIPELASYLMPVANFMLATKPLGPSVDVLGDHACYATTNFVLDYFRKSHDGRMIFGGLVAYDTNRRGPDRARLLARMTQSFPQLSGVDVDHVWAGLLAISRLRLPLIGSFAEGGYYAAGYSGHGLALTCLAGRAMADAALGEGGDFDDLAALPRKAFPGGRYLRLPLLLAITTYQRLHDKLGR